MYVHSGGVCVWGGGLILTTLRRYAQQCVYDDRLIQPYPCCLFARIRQLNNNNSSFAIPRALNFSRLRFDRFTGGNAGFWGCVFNLANAAMGAGVLAFPYAYEKAG